MRFLHRLIGESNNDGRDGNDMTSHSLETSPAPSQYELRFILGGIHVNHTTFMGHSHGGATVLTAANREPALVDAIVAHEPAIDWAPDDCRRALFLYPRLSGLAFSGSNRVIAPFASVVAMPNADASHDAKVSRCRPAARRPKQQNQIRHPQSTFCFFVASRLLVHPDPRRAVAGWERNLDGVVVIVVVPFPTI
jgi:pimeloyl-ACP methyl ester carboxylesterase